MEKIEPYNAVIIQPKVIVTFQRKEIKKNLERSEELIDAAAMWCSPMGLPARLVAFPEAFLHGTGMGMDLRLTLRDFKKTAITIPGEETDSLGERAQANRTYVVGHSYELDKEWSPERLFSTAFVISPEGKVIMKYRKVNVSNSPIELPDSPCEVLDEYMRKYGKGKTITETLFPVVKTRIGNIGCFICFDGFFPEPTRCLALNGAEVLVRPTAYMDPWVSHWGGIEAWQLQNRMRAFENRCYVVAPNIGEWVNAPHMPSMWDPGHSMIADPEGRVLCEASPGENMVAAVIDIERLRMMRRYLGDNLLPLIWTEAYADAYKKTIFPPNQWPDRQAETVIDRWEKIVSATEKLYSEMYGEKIDVIPPELPEPRPTSSVYADFRPEITWSNIVEQYRKAFGEKLARPRKP